MQKDIEKLKKLGAEITFPDDKVLVGDSEVKLVSKLNHSLYIKAEEILEGNQHKCHIGWSGVGKFIDWLEENYHLEKK